MKNHSAGFRKGRADKYADFQVGKLTKNPPEPRVLYNLYLSLFRVRLGKMWGNTYAVCRLDTGSTKLLAYWQEIGLLLVAAAAQV
jgi:hypothetical protein